MEHNSKNPMFRKLFPDFKTEEQPQTTPQNTSVANPPKQQENKHEAFIAILILLVLFILYNKTF